MDLIIGGAYQGKCTFAAEKYRLTAADICDLAADAPAPARCYVHLEALTRRGEAAEALPHRELLCGFVSGADRAVLELSRGGADFEAASRVLYDWARGAHRGIRNMTKEPGARASGSVFALICPAAAP